MLFRSRLGTIAVFVRDIKGQAESQLIQVKAPASLFVANENGNGSEAEVGIVAIRVKTAPVRKQGRRVSSGHQEQYSAGAAFRALVGKTGEIPQSEESRFLALLGMTIGSRALVGSGRGMTGTAHSSPRKRRGMQEWLCYVRDDESKP